MAPWQHDRGPTPPSQSLPPQPVRAALRLTPAAPAAADVRKAAAQQDSCEVAAARGGDFQAFERLVKRHQGYVYRLALGMVKSDVDAEEVVQETFLQVFRALESFAQESSVRTWLTRIAVNAALMRLRSQRRKPLLALEDHRAGCEPRDDAPFWAPNPWHSAPDTAVLDQELRLHIHAAVQKLPEKYRLVLLLRDGEEHSTAEVAHTLGLTEPTVKSRLHRARLYVRQELEHYFQRH